MKQILTLSILVFILSMQVGWAEIPQTMSYQGVLTDGSSTPVADGTYDLTFSIYNVDTVGTALWTEAQSVMVASGIFSVILGNVNPLDLPFDQQYWLGIAVGTGAELTPRTKLTSSPYSLGGNFWKLTGNADTNPTTHFLGTIDDQPLELRVNGLRAMRFEPNILPSWGNPPNIIGGYSGNWVKSGVVGVTISGGGSGVFDTRKNRVTDNYGTVGGGEGNCAGDDAGGSTDAKYATVGGGLRNTASGRKATVGGGSDNMASGEEATVGGGDNNTASEGATVGGGGHNDASGYLATVAGGKHNVASGDSATIGGGYQNNAGGEYATIGGGEDHNASGENATVGGGNSNTASGNNATASGGSVNTASGEYASVSGGRYNAADGLYSIVPGGYSNTAHGDYSFVAGLKATATHRGSFIWADASQNPAFIGFRTLADNEFAVRCTGGARFATAIDSNSNPTAGVEVSSGGGSWSSISDRNLKENFTPMDGREVLKRLASISVESWNYKSQDPSIRHIGPMAQDFYTTFGVGEDDKRITTVDADGVALAAIQGLYELVKEKDSKIAAQESRIGELEARLVALEVLVSPNIQGE